MKIVNQRLWQTVLLSPAIGGAIAATTMAQPTPPRTVPINDVMRMSQIDTDDADKPEDPQMEQVTSVSQLRDVRPTDWAFQALQSLVERYGCIVGYPDRTFRGNQALSRYEFAAGLNACLDKVNDLIQAGTRDLVKKEDFAVLQRLQEEFQTELVTLRGRINGLEARTATIEKQQFSTTTKLNAEVVVAVAGVATGDDATGNRINRNTIVGDRIRLNFDASFTGEDLLRVRLQAINLNAFSSTSTFTPEGDFRFAGGAFADSNTNSIGIDALLYQFNLGESTQITLEANAGAIDDFTNTVNPYLDGDGGTGALTHFGTRNAIYYLLNGAGIGIRQKFGEKLELNLGYLANDAANPSSGGGLFNGPYGAMAQLTFQPSEQFIIGATYIRAYNTDFTANGSTGSNRANLRSALLNNSALGGALAGFAGLEVPTSSDAYGLEASFQFTPGIVLNGSVGYTNTRTLSSLGGALPRGSLDIWNWSVGLAFPDLFRKGSLAGIIVGMEPKVTDVNGGLRSAIGKDPSTSIHVEGFYQFQLNDNIAITPGLIWLTAPDHNDDNADVVIGTVRATFRF